MINTKSHPKTRFDIFTNTWQEWAEGFQTLDDLQSVDLTPKDELRINQLLKGEAGDENELY